MNMLYIALYSNRGFVGHDAKTKDNPPKKPAQSASYTARCTAV
jgi:hypothetical protein